MQLIQNFPAPRSYLPDALSAFKVLRPHIVVIDLVIDAAHSSLLTVAAAVRPHPAPAPDVGVTGVPFSTSTGSSKGVNRGDELEISGGGDEKDVDSGSGRGASEDEGGGSGGRRGFWSNYLIVVIIFVILLLLIFIFILRTQGGQGNPVWEKRHSVLISSPGNY
ncbi:hypothetical protein RRG08_058446 [Elysia crispata]|uniref:Uncharacterized protein n=1 Tax=Elysia crispata TaxID=231223 RepID=A0AAE0XZG3_9GAST|nr:hypothetical protein RRG08_058446 [Elysia crispata]